MTPDLDYDDPLGSSAAADGGGPAPAATVERPAHWCEPCQRSFASARGLARHNDWAHTGRPNGRPPKPEKPRTIAAPALAPNLRQVEHELGQGIGAIGALVAGGLAWYRDLRETAEVVPGPTVAPVVGELKRLPHLETTFGHVIAERAPVTARVVMRYAEQNATLLKWVMRFNAALKGGEVGGLVMDHGAGLLHTLQPASEPLAAFVGMRTPTALQRVAEENEQLRSKLAGLELQLRRMHEQQGAAAASDGRGSGD